MARMYRILLTVVGTMTLLSGIVGYAGESPTPAGEVSFSGTVAAPASAGGVTWGKGILMLHDGTKHTFEVHGLGVRGSREAIVSVQAVSEVFHLQRPSEFEGTYKVNHTGIIVGRGPNEISLANEHGVTVALSLKVPATTSDVSLTPSPTGVTVKLIQ
ncbi:MAG: hypothetical protein ACRERE_18030 [Candidatus Entotheonellia bacterium]